MKCMLERKRKRKWFDIYMFADLDLMAFFTLSLLSTWELEATGPRPREMLMMMEAPSISGTIKKRKVKKLIFTQADYSK